MLQALTDCSGAKPSLYTPLSQYDPMAWGAAWMYYATGNTNYYTDLSTFYTEYTQAAAVRPRLTEAACWIMYCSQACPPACWQYMMYSFLWHALAARGTTNARAGSSAVHSPLWHIIVHVLKEMDTIVACAAPSLWQSTDSDAPFCCS